MSSGVQAAVAVLLFDDGKLLLGRRIKSQKFAGWQCPGGFMRSNESLLAAAKRCCLQKAGVEIYAVEQGPYTNNIFNAATQHSVTLYLIAREFKVVNSNLYSDTQLEWNWFKIDEIPSPQFKPLKQLLESYNVASLSGL